MMRACPKRSFRHRVMRHFLVRELGLNAVAVPGLPDRLQPASPRLHPVRRARAPERLTSPRRPAFRAEALPSIAPATETKLDSTPLAARQPVLGQRQDAPRRRFLDMEREPW